MLHATVRSVIIRTVTPAAGWTEEQVAGMLRNGNAEFEHEFRVGSRGTVTTNDQTCANWEYLEEAEPEEIVSVKIV